MKNKLLKNRASRKIIYNTCLSIMHILQRFSRSLGVTDINELADIIENMSIDEFCDFKFNDNDDVDLIEED